MAGGRSPFSGPWGMASQHDQVVSVDGHRIKLTNLDKVMYPANEESGQPGTTKGEVID
jgi:bifunctional non-homologous end joining protein LigD